MRGRGVSGGMVAAVVLGGRAAEALIFNPPHCALPGLQVTLFMALAADKQISNCFRQVGAGLGTVAGAFGGVAAAGDHCSSMAGIEDSHLSIPLPHLLVENLSFLAQVARQPLPPAPRWQSRRWQGAG